MPGPEARRHAQQAAIHSMRAPGRRRWQPFGREVKVDSIKTSYIESNATFLINVDRANDVPSHGKAVQVDSINPP
jgi:hypothetical protein